MIMKLAIGAVVLAALAFGGYHAYLYSLQIYATAPVYQTSRGALDGYDPVAYFSTCRCARPGARSRRSSSPPVRRTGRA